MPILIRGLATFAAGYGFGLGSSSGEKTSSNIKLIKLAGVGLVAYVVARKMGSKL